MHIYGDARIHIHIHTQIPRQTHIWRDAHIYTERQYPDTHRYPEKEQEATRAHAHAWIYTDTLTCTHTWE